jgi:hypothetical protein
MTRAIPFTKAQIKRAIDAAREAGLRVLAPIPRWAKMLVLAMLIFCGWLIFAQFTLKGRTCNAIGGTFDPIQSICKVPFKW